jgi:hypothetical protein
VATTVSSQDKERLVRQLGADYPIFYQQTDFVDAVKNRKTFALNEANGHKSCTLVNLGLIAMRVHRNLKFDPIKQEIVGDEEAKQLMDQPMRAPYIL